MKRLGPVLISCLVAVEAFCQDDAVKAAMYIHGLSCEEEVQKWMVESLQGLRPVSVNSPGRNAGALLSEYQLASLEDYRSRFGDILSYEELSLVDGFSKEAVAALKPYLSLYSKRLPGSVDTVRTKTLGLLRVTEKNAGGKLKLTGASWQAAGALRASIQDGARFTGSAHLQASWKDWALTLGDYNVRYGQGLSLWSGFSMTSLSTPDAFIRRPAGISPLWSFTSPEHRGAALEYGTGHFRACAFAAVDGFAGAHADYLWRYGQVGLSTALQDAGRLSFSADTRLNIRGVDLAGEAALGRGSYALNGSGGLRAGPVRLVFQGRAMPSRYTGKKYGEYGLAAGAAWKSDSRKHSVSLTLDGALLPVPVTATDRRQLRIYAMWKWQISESLALESRYTGRLRNYEPSRNDLRVDARFAGGPWLSSFRLEAVHCDSFGILSYLEGGYKDTSLSAYLRITAYATGGWNSRIYCYERDAPGNFSVPAYSGRGVCGSIYGGWKKRFGRAALKLYLRGSLAAAVSKPPSGTLRLQAQFEY